MFRILVFFLVSAAFTPSQANVHIPNPFPEFASTKVYPNLGKDPNSQRRYFKDYATHFYDLYTEEFVRENKLSRNLFERRKFLSEAHAGIDQAPDAALLYLSETFRKAAFANLLTMAREKYPEVFKHGTVVAQDDAEDSRAKQNNETAIELSLTKQKVMDLERQINVLKSKNDKLLAELRQASANRNRAAQATPPPADMSTTAAEDTSSEQTEEGGSKLFSLLRKLSTTQKVILFGCLGLLALALLMRRKS